jgi:hypothetical protein
MVPRCFLTVMTNKRKYMQCQAITKNNFQCSRNSLEGSRLCRQHQTMVDNQHQLLVQTEIKTEANRLSQLGQEWRRSREQMSGTWEHYLATTNFKKPHCGWRRPGTERYSEIWRQQIHLQKLREYAENLFHHADVGVGTVTV